MSSTTSADRSGPPRRLLSVAALCGLASLARVAGAQAPEANRALARTLFEQGRELMSAKRFAEACPKFAESARLDPAAGTRLNLAVCHEGEGKTATAWQEFNDAVTQARLDGRSDREELARKHIAALVPVLSRLRITVEPGAPAEGLEVRFDGVVIGPASWGTDVPVDPGVHTVAATAPGHRPWSEKVEIKPAGDRRTIVVPRLPAGPSEGSVVLGPVGPNPGPAESSLAARRIAGWITVGAGAVGVGLGTYFGVRAISDWKDRNGMCTAAGCSTAGVSSGDAANLAAWGADVGIGAGVVALGVGTYLLISSRRPADKPFTMGETPKPPPQASAVRVTPFSGPRRAGISVEGSF